MLVPIALAQLCIVAKNSIEDVMEKEGRLRISVNLRRELVDDLEELANKEHRTRNNMVEHLLTNAIKDIKDEEQKDKRQ